MTVERKDEVCLHLLSKSNKSCICKIHGQVPIFFEQLGYPF